MIKRFAIVLILFSSLMSGQGAALPHLQLFVDLTPVGGTLRPPPGRYAGPVLINKPLTLDGQGEVVIDGEGQGSVVIVKTDNAVVRNLQITHSGLSHDQVDAGIQVLGDSNTIENNRLEQVLFGIHLQQANNNLIKGNRVSSVDAEPSLRGEGLRLWYSRKNRIEANRFEKVRDVLFTNSEENRVIGNRVSDSRIGMEFVFSHNNHVGGNVLARNSEGIVSLYSNDLYFEENEVSHIRNVTGSAISIKGSSGVVLNKNSVLNCSLGLAANTPTHPENILYLTNNRFAYNDVAMYFYGEKGGHILHGNRFEENNIPVAVSAPTSALGNDWRGNSWDNYNGFDQDGDGAGDVPHEVYLYSDLIWMDRPMTRFFRGAPVLEMIDLVERLAPFSDPKMILSDPAPLVELTPYTPTRH